MRNEDAFHAGKLVLCAVFAHPECHCEFTDTECALRAVNRTLACLGLPLLSAMPDWDDVILRGGDYPLLHQVLYDSVRAGHSVGDLWRMRYAVVSRAPRAGLCIARDLFGTAESLVFAALSCRLMSPLAIARTMVAASAGGGLTTFRIFDVAPLAVRCCYVSLLSSSGLVAAVDGYFSWSVATNSGDTDAAMRKLAEVCSSVCTAPTSYFACEEVGAVKSELVRIVVDRCSARYVAAMCRQCILFVSDERKAGTLGPLVDVDDVTATSTRVYDLLIRSWVADCVRRDMSMKLFDTANVPDTRSPMLASYYARRDADSDDELEDIHDRMCVHTHNGILPPSSLVYKLCHVVTSVLRLPRIKSADAIWPAAFLASISKLVEGAVESVIHDSADHASLTINTMRAHFDIDGDARLRSVVARYQSEKHKQYRVRSQIGRVEHGLRLLGHTVPTIGSHEDALLMRPSTPAAVTPKIVTNVGASSGGGVSYASPTARILRLDVSCSDSSVTTLQYNDEARMEYVERLVEARYRTVLSVAEQCESTLSLLAGFDVHAVFDRVSLTVRDRVRSADVSSTPSVWVEPNTALDSIADEDEDDGMGGGAPGMDLEPVALRIDTSTGDRDAVWDVSFICFLSGTPSASKAVSMFDYRVMCAQAEESSKVATRAMSRLVFEARAEGDRTETDVLNTIRDCFVGAIPGALYSSGRVTRVPDEVTAFSSYCVLAHRGDVVTEVGSRLDRGVRATVVTVLDELRVAARTVGRVVRYGLHNMSYLPLCCGYINETFPSVRCKVARLCETKASYHHAIESVSLFVQGLTDEYVCDTGEWTLVTLVEPPESSMVTVTEVSKISSLPSGRYLCEVVFGSPGEAVLAQSISSIGISAKGVQINLSSDETLRSRVTAIASLSLSRSCLRAFQTASDGVRATVMSVEHMGDGEVAAVVDAGLLDLEVGKRRCQVTPVSTAAGMLMRFGPLRDMPLSLVDTGSYTLAAMAIDAFTRHVSIAERSAADREDMECAVTYVRACKSVSPLYAGAADVAQSREIDAMYNDAAGAVGACVAGGLPTLRSAETFLKTVQLMAVFSVVGGQDLPSVDEFVHAVLVKRLERAKETFGGSRVSRPLSTAPIRRSSSAPQNTPRSGALVADGVPAKYEVCWNIRTVSSPGVQETRLVPYVVHLLSRAVFVHEGLSPVAKTVERVLQADARRLLSEVEAEMPHAGVFGMYSTTPLLPPCRRVGAGEVCQSLLFSAVPGVLHVSMSQSEQPSPFRYVSRVRIPPVPGGGAAATSAYLIRCAVDTLATLSTWPDRLSPYRHATPSGRDVHEMYRSFVRSVFQGDTRHTPAHSHLRFQYMWDSVSYAKRRSDQSEATVRFLVSSFQHDADIESGRLHQRLDAPDRLLVCIEPNVCSILGVFIGVTLWRACQLAIIVAADFDADRVGMSFHTDTEAYDTVASLLLSDACSAMIHHEPLLRAAGFDDALSWTEYTRALNETGAFVDVVRKFCVAARAYRERLAVYVSNKVEEIQRLSERYGACDTPSDTMDAEDMGDDADDDLAMRVASERSSIRALGTIRHLQSTVHSLSQGYVNAMSALCGVASDTSRPAHPTKAYGIRVVPFLVSMSQQHGGSEDEFVDAVYRYLTSDEMSHKLGNAVPGFYSRLSLPIYQRLSGALLKETGPRIASEVVHVRPSSDLLGGTPGTTAASLSVSCATPLASPPQSGSDASGSPVGMAGKQPMCMITGQCDDHTISAITRLATEREARVCVVLGSYGETDADYHRVLSTVGVTEGATRFCLVMERALGQEYTLGRVGRGAHPGRLVESVTWSGAPVVPWVYSSMGIVRDVSLAVEPHAMLHTPVDVDSRLSMADHRLGVTAYVMFRIQPGAVMRGAAEGFSVRHGGRSLFARGVSDTRSVLSSRSTRRSTCVSLTRMPALAPSPLSGRASSFTVNAHARRLLPSPPTDSPTLGAYAAAAASRCATPRGAAAPVRRWSNGSVCTRGACVMSSSVHATLRGQLNRAYTYTPPNWGEVASLLYRALSHSEVCDIQSLLVHLGRFDDTGVETALRNTQVFVRVLHGYIAEVVGFPIRFVASRTGSVQVTRRAAAEVLHTLWPRSNWQGRRNLSHSEDMISAFFDTYSVSDGLVDVTTLDTHLSMFSVQYMRGLVHKDVESDILYSVVCAMMWRACERELTRELLPTILPTHHLIDVTSNACVVVVSDAACDDVSVPASDIHREMHMFCEHFRDLSVSPGHSEWWTPAEAALARARAAAPDYAARLLRGVFVFAWSSDTVYWWSTLPDTHRPVAFHASSKTASPFKHIGYAKLGHYTPQGLTFVFSPDREVMDSDMAMSAFDYAAERYMHVSRDDTFHLPAWVHLGRCVVNIGST